MHRTLLTQRSLLHRRIVAMRSSTHVHGTERITLDGTIQFSSSSVAPAPAPVAAAAAIVPPDARPPSDADVERLADFVATSSGGLVVLTGAGISTDAGLPDYRGPNGAYSQGFKPMTQQAFLASDANRRRYWARAFAGWEGFSRAEPAAAHTALARLQKRGWVREIVTQNVDRLHTRAGADPQRVLELHGSTHDVVCLSCGSVSPRAPLQAAMAALNPEAAAAARARARASSPYVSASASATTAALKGTPGLDKRDDEEQQQQELQRRPDGDAEVAESRDKPFLVPPCPACGAGGGGGGGSEEAQREVALKPHVVFFGDGVPQDRADRALRLAQTAAGLLVVGSSLRVWSAFRLVKAAADNGVPIAILNWGATRADEQLPPGKVALRIEALAGEALARLERHPRLQLPAAAARWG
jgi:NAD-dependent deacetylase sirtuin 4